MNFKMLLGTLLLVPTITSANTCYTKSDTLIKGLYKTFPVDESNKIREASPTLLNKFFSKKLSDLIIKDEKCAERVQGLCNIDFDISTGAQDSPDQNKYTIIQSTNTQVKIQLEYNHTPELLIFKINSKSKCMLIEDIYYQNEKISLLKLLNKKVL